MSWRYDGSDAHGFRVQLLYPITQSLFSYITSFDQRTLLLPRDAWPSAEPGDPQCRDRWIGIAVVYALREETQARVGSITVHTAC